MALPTPVNQQNLQVRMNDGSFKRVCPFPVGYIYQSYNSASPADIYGGSWTPITGRFLYCNNGTGVGGSNTHKLTVNEMPGHSHGMTKGATPEGGSYPIKELCYLYKDWGNTNWLTLVVSTSSVGGNQAHNNMPAYQTCYAWRRTN